MKIHILQHVPFEGAANVGIWAQDRGHGVTCTRLYTEDALPELEAIDWLVIMGGPMNVNQEAQYPWLRCEKQFITQAIEQKRFILGICLGAQLIAHCLGATVTQNSYPEIGWYDVTLTSEASNSLLGCLPSCFEAFHWHGDTFSLPPGTAYLATSEACKNQAFQYQDHVLALQFHLDYAYDDLKRMVDHCGDQLTQGKYVQQPVGFLSDNTRVMRLQERLYTLLDHCALQYPPYHTA